ncbi:hypothetical protein LEP1GSC008_3490 [Leptospira kirschneri serovar Bulgarica str. Nikolaevo]|uniref:Uncharacterized protein n=1 Tax=Leptospira kirschneri serovar Bulgarica str. Nikolaevo TaxID=1240687 RepID=M6F1K6_9LEPT|nr:hypothetical protein LEP1GSC008_3490 [Leptospira kirschneri serovar Bulgarica str. Nikolaevo]
MTVKLPFSNTFKNFKIKNGKPILPLESRHTRCYLFPIGDLIL